MALYLSEYDYQDALIAASDLIQPPTWSPVSSDGVTYWITSDALIVDDGEGSRFRPSVTPLTQQALLDKLQLLPVPLHVAELVLDQATIHLEPMTRPAGADMSSKTAMLEHSARIEEALSELTAPPGALIDNAGKLWLGEETLGANPVNFGWKTISAPYSHNGVSMWQTPGRAHGWTHVDYSQTIRAMWPYAFMEGRGWFRLPDYRCAPSSAAPQSIPPKIDQSAPVLRRGSKGQGVKDWQTWLSSNWATVWVDGDFGPQTEGATKGWQRAAGIEQTGVVDEYVLAAARLWEERKERREPSELDIPYLEARNYTRRERFSVDWIVIHSAETAETPTVAEALQSWCAGPHAPQASWHYAVDNNSITQSVRDNFIAWHAPGANDAGIGIELGGRAAQTREQWLDAYGQAMLDNAARLLAYLSQKWDIPLEFVNEDGLKAGERGVTTHRAVTYAWRKSTHIDPGAHFPMDELLARARARLSE